METKANCQAAEELRATGRSLEDLVRRERLSTLLIGRQSATEGVRMGLADIRGCALT